MRQYSAIAALTAALLVSACGGGSDTGGTVAVDNSNARGTLQYNPPLQVTSMSASAFQANLGSTATGAGLLTLAGTPTCGISYYYLQYGTVGGAGETTNATGVMMVPTGTAPACVGPHPIVLYAHGTTTDWRSHCSISKLYLGK